MVFFGFGLQHRKPPGVAKTRSAARTGIGHLPTVSTYLGALSVDLLASVTVEDKQ